MASKKKQKGMVFHQDGASTPAAAHRPPGAFRMEQGGQVTRVNGGLVGKPNMCPPKDARLPAGNHPSSSSVQSENLPPESTCKGVTVVLDNNSMWNEFFRCKTEMILTKQGSRMFPYCRFRISGLQPSKKYSLVMDIQAVDNSRYRWTGKSWQVAGKTEGPVKSQPFTHPESPSTGQHWMQSPVSFYKLKLTNNTADQDGNTVLHSMHRYLPRLHVVQTEKAAKDIRLNGPGVVTFTFPQTEFMAVTAYQNTQFTQLKVDYNPFAKGLKEDGSSSWSLKPKLNSSKDSNQPTKQTTTAEQHPVKKSLKSLLANHKPRSSKATEQKPTWTSDHKRNSTINNDQSTAKTSGEPSCPRPAQKLFSELIREAHVSLQRCNLEQLGLNISPGISEQTNTKTDDLQGQATKGSLSVQSPPVKTGDTVGTRRTAGPDQQPSKDSPRTDCTKIHSQTPAPRLLHKTSVGSDRECKPEASSAVKLQKRPAPLPLPALALFLKQHSAKSKKVKSKPESPHPLPEVKPGLLAEKFNSPSASACGPSNTVSFKDVSGLTGIQTTGFHSHGLVQTGQLFGPSCQDAAEPTEPQRATTKDCMESVVPENLIPEPPLPDATPVVPKMAGLNQPFCALATSVSTISPTPATSSTSPVSSTHLHSTVLATADVPQTDLPPSTTPPPGSPLMTPGTVLPDPECLPFGFEPLSPASSPESLPPLPASITLDLDSTSSEPTSKAIPIVEEPQSKDRVEAGSVFKWHTVLPPPEPYIPPSFTAFQTTPQPPTVGSVTPSLIPSQTSSDPLRQTLDMSTSTPPSDPPSYRENEQSLPFPAELSPLVLPLPLSPTFSSLDGDGLSPTPSITDLVHFFSTEDDLGIEVEFSNPEVVTDSCPPPVTAVERHEHAPPPVSPTLTNKHKCKKKSQKQKVTKTEGGNKASNSYTSMKPNLEEVEEQLFISFTSKEALELHIGDSPDSVGPTVHPPQLQMTSGDEPQQTTQTPANDGVMQRIAALEKILLRDMKLMKHRQVIHPVLQEVGLKLNLLDPTLAIDLQYLGVLLPLPPPGLHLEPPVHHQSVSAAFVSRTGKTTDVTQIKGWRLKFSPSEPPRPEGNLPSAADVEVSEHADRFQPAVTPCPQARPSSEPPKKNLSAFCSDMLDQYLENEGKLIDERAASFSQPVSEPVVYELPTHSACYVRTLDSVLRKHKAPSPTTDLISGFIPPSKRPRLTPKDLKSSRRGERKQNLVKATRLRPKSDATLTPTPPLHHTAYGPPRTKRNPLKLKPAPNLMMDHTEWGPGLMKRKLKPRARSRTLGPSAAGGDFEPTSNPLMTRALLKQKDLEDGVMWGGRPRTFITEERASVALTSLFTLMGFVSENPTAPLPVVRRRAPPCLNEFCRLGCVCSSLSHSFSVSHCGRPPCMLGCSCLKQKVVLLKNLEGPDSSPSHHGPGRRRRRRRRRMKMAYVLKEADHVSQPAERVRTLWKRDSGGSDPDPVHTPEPAPCSPSAENGRNGSCARVRGFPEQNHKQKQKKKHLKNSSERPSGETPALPEDPPPKPSKRLIIVAECKWASEGDRDQVLMRLCEAMAQDRLDRTFYLQNYLIQPLCQTVDNDDGSRCIQYKVRISRPRVDPEGPAGPGLGPGPGSKRMMEFSEVEHLLDCHDQGEGPVEEAEPLEDWQREVEDDVEEDPTAHQVHDGKEIDRGSEEKEAVVNMALPLLTGISPAGFLSANRKQPGGTDHVIQVNGKLYPLAKIQLGKMGALHPANRLAAYLTGRVGTSRRNQDLAPPMSKPVEVQFSSSSPASSELSKLAAAINAITSTQTLSAQHEPLSAQHEPLSTQTLSAQTLSAQTQPLSAQPLSTQSQALSTQPLSAQTLSAQPLSLSTLKPTDPQVPGRPPAKQVLMIQVPGPHGKVPLQLPVPRPVAPPSTGQKVMLRSVSGQTSSIVKLFRRPDGKLVQLIPVTQLRPIPPMSANAIARPGSSPSPTVLPAASLPFITTKPLTLTAAVGPTVGPAPLSGLQSFTVSPGSTPLQSGPGLLSQKGTCTLKILPSKSRSEAVVVAGPKSSQISATLAPAPGAFTPLTPTPNHSLFSQKPSEALGAEPGVQSVIVACHKPAPSQDDPDVPKTQAPPTATPLGSEVRRELACDPQDLDIICVDEDTLDQMENNSVEPVDLSSEETENSSDFSDGSDNEDKKNQRPRPPRRDHNASERRRRTQMRRLFDGLRTEVGLTDDKTSKVTILQKAVLVIQQLRATEAGLKRRKSRLRRQWNTYLDTLTPPTDGRQVEMPINRGGGARRRRRADMDVVEVVDLLSESEQMENPAAVTKATSVWSLSSDEEQNFSTDLQRKLMRMMKDLDVDPGDGLKSRAATAAAFDTLGSVLNVHTSEKRLLLDKACKEVEVLQSLKEKLKNQKQRLKQDRDAYVSQISVHSGKSEQKILRKLHHLSSKQNKLEKIRAANQQSAPGGGGATSVVQPQTSQTRPTQEISATPTCSPLVQMDTASTVSTLAHCVVSHNAAVFRDRPRTVPNILSRSKNPQRSAPATVTAETASSIQTVAPASVLSLVSTALPGQQVLALGPLVTGQTALQTTRTPGMTSVTLNIPSLTNQQIHLTSVPHPPPDANVNHLLQLAPPTVQPTHPPVPVSTYPALPDLPPSAPTPPPAALVLSGGSGLASDQSQDQDSPPQSSGRGLDDSSKDSLTSLLNEIVFLNQQPVSTSTEEEEEDGAQEQVGSQEQGCAPDGPWLLHLDEDSEGEEPGAELNGHLSELTHNSDAAALAPPPLLQMRVGGLAYDSAAPTTSGISAVEQEEGGVAWRPMPRLVPLGLRGNQNQV